MTKRRKQMLAVGIAILVFYVLGYGYARITHRIVHIENRGVGRHQVLAKSDAWDQLYVDMAEGKPAAEAHARALQKVPSVLNVLFWPLRAVESTYWNVMER